MLGKKKSCVTPTSGEKWERLRACSASALHALWGCSQSGGRRLRPPSSSAPCAYSFLAQARPCIWSAYSYYTDFFLSRYYYTSANRLLCVLMSACMCVCVCEWAVLIWSVCEWAVLIWSVCEWAVLSWSVFELAVFVCVINLIKTTPAAFALCLPSVWFAHRLPCGGKSIAKTTVHVQQLRTVWLCLIKKRSVPTLCVFRLKCKIFS